LGGRREFVESGVATEVELKMKALVLAACVVGVIPVWAMAQQTVTINPGVRHQSVAGWGTFLGATDTATRTAYRDLGMNIMRMSIEKNTLTASSSDWRIRVPLGTDLNANVAKFNMNVSPVSNFGSTAQWMNQNTLEPSRFKLIADAWSPPHWMKGPTGSTQQWVGNPSSNSPARQTPWLSNEYNNWYNAPGGGHFLNHTGDSIGGRLRTEDATNLAEYGRYFAGYVKAFENRYGVKIDNISLQNESGFENPFDSMTFLSTATGGYDAGQYAAALKSVRTAFTQQGITTKVRGPHYANLQANPSSPWGLLHQMNMINGVKNDSDPTLKDFMWAYTSNYYNDTSEGSVKNTAAYWRGTANVPGPWANWAATGSIGGDGKENWFVETGDGPATWLNGPNNTPGNGAISVALKMHNALVHANASAYLYWSFVDGVGSPTEHGLLGSGQQSNPMSSKKYAAFKQFSRFIRPGARRINATFGNGLTSVGGASEYDTLSSVNVSAYYHDEDRMLTLVLLNLESTSQSVTLNIPADLGVAQMDVYRTSGTENFVTLADVFPLAGAPTITLPAYSVVTLTGRAFTVIPEPSGLGVIGVVGLALVRRRR